MLSAPGPRHAVNITKKKRREILHIRSAASVRFFPQGEGGGRGYSYIFIFIFCFVFSVN